MRAAVGDRIIIKGHHVGEPDRDGRILEVRGTDGGPPYLVQWEEDGHEGVLFPGADAVVHHFAHDIELVRDALPVPVTEAGLPVVAVDAPHPVIEERS